MADAKVNLPDAVSLHITSSLPSPSGTGYYNIGWINSYRIYWVSKLNFHSPFVQKSLKVRAGYTEVLRHRAPLPNQLSYQKLQNPTLTSHSMDSSASRLVFNILLHVPESNRFHSTWQGWEPPAVFCPHKFRPNRHTCPKVPPQFAGEGQVKIPELSEPHTPLLNRKA